MTQCRHYVVVSILERASVRHTPAYVRCIDFSFSDNFFWKKFTSSATPTNTSDEQCQSELYVLTHTIPVLLPLACSRGGEYPSFIPGTSVTCYAMDFAVLSLQSQLFSIKK